MKVIGRRKPGPGGLEAANPFLKTVIAVRGNKPFIPRGVHRFYSHEEKDAWTLKMLTRGRLRRNTGARGAEGFVFSRDEETLAQHFASRSLGVTS